MRRVFEKKKNVREKDDMMMGDNGGKGKNAIEERRRRSKVTNTHTYIYLSWKSAGNRR